MTLIALKDAELAFGLTPLLDRASLAISDGERIGLIGRNGTGKSSLLNVLAGSIALDDGEVQRKPGLRVALVEQALSSRRFGPYTLQAAIAAVHAEATEAPATDWAQIVALYDVLLRTDPSPVVELNRAVAVTMRDGPVAGLELIDAILARGDLADYHLAHSARADLCRRLGKTAEARESYQRALALTRQAPERRFLERRLAALPQKKGNE